MFITRLITITRRCRCRCRCRHRGIELFWDYSIVKKYKQKSLTNLSCSIKWYRSLLFLLNLALNKPTPWRSYESHLVVAFVAVTKGWAQKFCCSSLNLQEYWNKSTQTCLCVSMAARWESKKLDYTRWTLLSALQSCHWSFLLMMTQNLDWLTDGIGKYTRFKRQMWFQLGGYQRSSRLNLIFFSQHLSKKQISCLMELYLSWETKADWTTIEMMSRCKQIPLSKHAVNYSELGVRTGCMRLRSEWVGCNNMIIMTFSSSGGKSLCWRLFYCLREWPWHCLCVCVLDCKSWGNVELELKLFFFYFICLSSSSHPCKVNKFKIT